MSKTIETMAIPEAPGRLTQWGRELGVLVMLALAILAVRDIAVNQYVVPSASMQPTLRIGDRVIADMRAYGWRVPFTQWHIGPRSRPARGDVVVFHAPSGERMVKRVVAVAGDSVQVRQGMLYLDGVPVARPDVPTIEWLRGRPIRIAIEEQGGPDMPAAVVPPGKVLVLGDNRGNSVDGRRFGWVDEEAVFAKAVRVAYRQEAGFQWLGL